MNLVKIYFLNNNGATNDDASRPWGGYQSHGFDGLDNHRSTVPLIVYWQLDISYM